MTTTGSSTLAEEYEVLVTSCGLVDRSERGKLALTGPGAAEFLNGQVTNDIVTLAPGRGCYAAFLTHKGKMLGDLRVLAVAGAGEEGDELLLDTERVALQALFDMIRRFKVGHPVELHKRTLENGLLSLIGPHAREVAARAVDQHPLTLELDEHAHVAAAIDGEPVRLISTVAGADVLGPAEATARLKHALTTAGAREVSEAAAEIVRVELGLPRYGLDMDDTTIPQEAGLNERAVSFDKGCYVGQETVARLFYRGKPNRHLRGLRLNGPASTGDELRAGERVVGHLGSVVDSPRLGELALGLVRREVAPGDELAVASGASATVVELPFEP